jgi:hypothetical protein
MATVTSLEPVVAELDFQLTQWYESLPLPLQFPFARVMLPDSVQTALRLRFFACRTIIYRPYILAVLQNEQAVLDPAVRDMYISVHTFLRTESGHTIKSDDLEDVSEVVTFWERGLCVTLIASSLMPVMNRALASSSTLVFESVDQCHPLPTSQPLARDGL